MSDEARDRLVEIFFRAFPSMDGEELGMVLEEVRKVVDEDLRRACWLRRRWVQQSCATKN